MDRTMGWILIVLIGYIAWVLSGKPDLFRDTKIIRPNFRDKRKKKGEKGNATDFESAHPPTQETKKTASLLAFASK